MLLDFGALELQMKKKVENKIINPSETEQNLRAFPLLKTLVST